MGLAFYGQTAHVVAATPSSTIVRAYEVKSGLPIARFDLATPVDEVIVSGNARRIVTHELHATVVRLWDLAGQKELAAIPATQEFTSTAAGPFLKWAGFSADGTRFVTQIAEGTVAAWDAATGRQVATVHEGKSLYSVELSTDGKYLLATADDDVARIWKLETGVIESQISAGGVVHADFSRGGTEVVISAGSVVRVMDKAFTRDLGPPNSRNVTFAELDTSTKRVLAMWRSSVVVWDVATGLDLWHPDSPQGYSLAAFAPDGRGVLTLGMGNNGPARLVIPNWLNPREGPVIETVCRQRLSGMTLLTERDARATSILEGIDGQDVCATEGYFKTLWQRARLALKNGIRFVEDKRPI